MDNNIGDMDNSDYGNMDNNDEGDMDDNDDSDVDDNNENDDDDYCPRKKFNLSTNPLNSFFTLLLSTKFDNLDKQSD